MSNRSAPGTSWKSTKKSTNLHVPPPSSGPHPCGNSSALFYPARRALGRSRSNPRPDRLITAPAVHGPFRVDADYGRHELLFSSQAFDTSLQTGIVHASNRTNGAAMSFLKKRDVMNHLSVSRNTSQHSLRPVGRPKSAGFSKIKPELTRANQRAFVEDFNLEHSFSDLSIVQIAISASADLAVHATPGSRRAYDRNSLNCVYIG